MLAEIFEFVKNQLLTNNFLQGILGGIFVTGIAFIFKSIPKKIYAQTRASLISELSINSEGYENYFEIVNYMSNFVIQRFNRAYTISRRNNQIVAGYGQMFGFYRGILFLSNRAVKDNKYAFQEDLNLTFFTRNKRIIENFVIEALTKEEQHLTKIMYITAFGGYSGSIKRPKRNLDSVFASDAVKQNLVENLTLFYNREEFYSTRGINYKYCILLHGIPGTGKTSLIAAMAAYFDACLYIIDNLEDLRNVTNSFSENKKNFVVVEDIDTMSNNLKRIADKKKSDELENEDLSSTNSSPTEHSQQSIIHNLLQTLDGFSTPWGMVVFITTNYIEELDSALIRPGRVDVKYELKALEHAEIRSMFHAFYAGNVSIDRYLESEQYRPQRGAYLQALFLAESDPDRAVDKLLLNLDK